MQRSLIVGIATFFIVAASSASASAQDEIDVSYGGWAAVGGSVTWAATAPLMQFVIQQIMTPADPEVCEITPARCEAGWLEYTLSGLTVAATIGLTVAGGWGAAEAADAFELDPGLGWGLSGGIVGLPVFGMLWLSIPKFDPGWLNSTLGTVFTLAGSVGTGFYFAEIGNSRGHAWPEFGFGIGGVLAGAGVGSIICGGTACAATPLGGAIGGILGVGLSTLFWGTGPDTAATPAMQAVEQQPLIHYEMTF